WLLLSTNAARADDAAKKVVDAAIKAHGGAEKLKMLSEKASVLKGKLKIYAMGLELDGTMEMQIGDKKFRQDIKFAINGMDIEQAVAYDGKEVWIALNGKVVQTLDKKEDLELLADQMHAEEAAGLTLLSSKDVALSIIGDDKVGDTP